MLRTVQSADPHGQPLHSIFRKAPETNALACFLPKFVVRQWIVGLTFHSGYPLLQPQAGLEKRLHGNSIVAFAGFRDGGYDFGDVADDLVMNSVGRKLGEPDLPAQQGSCDRIGDTELR